MQFHRKEIVVALIGAVAVIGLCSTALPALAADKKSDGQGRSLTVMGTAGSMGGNLDRDGNKLVSVTAMKPSGHLPSELADGMGARGGPPNDNCEDAPVDSLNIGETLTYYGTLTGATATCPALDSLGETWHAFDLTETAHVIASHCGTDHVFFSPFTVLVTECPCSGAFVFADFFDQGTCDDGNWAVHYDALPAGDYWSPINLDPGAGNDGPHVWNISALGLPDNDNCEDAIPIEVGDVLDGTNCVGNSDGSASCGLTGDNPDLWYSFTAPVFGRAFATTCGSYPGTHTVLSVHEGCPGGIPNELDCGDSNCDFFNSEVSWDVIAGATYLIRVSWGLGTVCGPFNLNMGMGEFSCGTGSGNCCETHPWPGCEEPACCDLVCSIDPFCCDSSWDNQCLDHSLALCEVCADVPTCPGEGDCCEINGSWGCEDEVCCVHVCSQDLFCCEVSWDQSCVDLALTQCDVCDDGRDVCPGQGSCCETNDSPGCEDQACCEAVCAINSFCCESYWEPQCAVIAYTECEMCADVFTCPGEGDCCEINGSPGCDDETCCEQVCLQDVFCCDVSWDELCVEHAQAGCCVCADFDGGVVCPTPALCDGDVNGDGLVDPLDSGAILARFGLDPCNEENCQYDLNCDGVIDPLDSGYVLARFGVCNPATSCTICNDIPVYDTCQEAPVISLSAGETQSYFADNTGATRTCELLPNGDNCGDGETWHAFEIGETLDVTTSLCGTYPPFENTFSMLETACPCEGAFVFANFQSKSTCDDGNWTLRWDALPAGVYWAPIWSSPYNDSSGPYFWNISAD